MVHPAKDGTTYVVVGSAGRPRYAWSGAVEGDRNFLAGVDTGQPGNGVSVAGDPDSEIGPYVSQKDFTDAYESIDWSQARYRDYAFIALDVVPARAGPDHVDDPAGHQRAWRGVRPRRVQANGQH